MQVTLASPSRKGQVEDAAPGEVTPESNCEQTQVAEAGDKIRVNTQEVL